MARPLRVYAVRRCQRNPPGYAGYEWISVQKLQEKRWWGWKTLDEEIVPECVKIAIGCFGEDGDSNPWMSKFYSLGSWGRDGIVTRHMES